MKCVLPLLIVAISCASSFGAQLQITNVVKASICFQEESKTSSNSPDVILVYLHLENLHDSDVTWVCNSVTDIDADLIDPKGKVVPQSPSAADIMSSSRAYMLPYHSQLDWMISHGGISMARKTDLYALMVAGKGWLLPKKDINAYSLSVRVRGEPWTQYTMGHTGRDQKVLFEIPPSRIRIK